MRPVSIESTLLLGPTDLINSTSRKAELSEVFEM